MKQGSGAGGFPGWQAALAVDASLSPGLRESYRRALEGFERFCQKRSGRPDGRVAGDGSGAGRRARIALAREYVELQRLERVPGPAQLQEWKEALNWYFRQGKADVAAALTGVPTLGRADLGSTAWEERLVRVIRVRHYSWRTEQTYRGWAWRLARFLGERPLESATGEDVRAFLTRLATEERVGVATQKQALNALVFLLRESEGKAVGEFGDFTRARRRARMPVVLSRGECERLFEALEGTARLMAELAYGSGLRLMELLRLRVKDVDLDRRQLVVRAGKGDKDRVTVLPERLLERLAAHRERLRRLHAADREKGLPGVWLPEGLERLIGNCFFAAPTVFDATRVMNTCRKCSAMYSRSPAAWNLSIGSRNGFRLFPSTIWPRGIAHNAIRLIPASYRFASYTFASGQFAACLIW